MFPKLLLVIAVMGVTAGALLVNRQKRIQAAHETALLHQDLVRQRQDSWELRRRIAALCAPDGVRQALPDPEAWSPIAAETSWESRARSPES